MSMRISATWHRSSGKTEKSSILNYATGYNHARCYHKDCTTHAEVDAINRLKPLRNIKKSKLCKVDLMVIRVNQSGNLANSMPCHNCADYMKTVAVKKGYKIKNIYYSTPGGSIDHAIL
jgi:hypothetical protein